MISEFYLSSSMCDVACTWFNNKNNILIVFSNGLLQHKSEPQNFTATMAKRFYDNKVDSILFDYLGLGDSSGLITDFTLEGMQTSFGKVLDFVNSMESHKYDHIIFIGYGLGYKISIDTLAEYKMTTEYSFIGINPYFDYHMKPSLIDLSEYPFNDEKANNIDKSNFCIDVFDVTSPIRFLAYCGIRFGEYQTYLYYKEYFKLNSALYLELNNLSGGIKKHTAEQYLLLCKDDLRLKHKSELSNLDAERIKIEYIDGGSIDYRTAREKDRIFDYCFDRVCQLI